MNDTGLIAKGLQIVFSEPVTLGNFGDIFTKVEATGPSTKFTFSGDEVSSWEGHWLNWTQQKAIIESTQWLISYHIPSQSQEPELPIELSASSSTDPDTYLYVPKITYSQDQHHCLDCKTFAIVAVMRYYGDPVTFEDICREVGQPPGPVYEDIAFFRQLIEFVRSRGFIVEDHFWRVDQIIAQVEEGRPVIASHRFGDLAAEPGIVKGTTNSHVWVWGVQEYLTQRSKDSLYTQAELQALLEEEDSGTGMMGYVPELFPQATNCLLIYKPRANVMTSPYEIEVVSYSDRSQSSEAGGPGVARIMSFAGDGEMRWSGPLHTAENTQIEVLIYNSEYVVDSDVGPAVIFAAGFLPGSKDAGTSIQGYSNTEKTIWRSPLGHTFEKVIMPVVRLSNAWVGSITINPSRTLEQLIVQWPFDCENRPFFGYEIRVEE